jgi:hypothetical protein
VSTFQPSFIQSKGVPGANSPAITHCRADRGLHFDAGRGLGRKFREY